MTTINVKENFNQLTPKETELLAILAEECVEVIQVVGKILRHGLASCNPFDDNQTPNRFLLMKELGDVSAAMTMLCEANILDEAVIKNKARRKLENVKQWTHHQGDSE